MKKLKFWFWKCFHQKKIRCRHFCGRCEFYDFCCVEAENPKKQDLILINTERDNKSDKEHN